MNDGEVLIDVSFCGVCGSDLHAVNHSRGYEFVKEGRTLGHEASGKVVKVKNKEHQYLINKNVIIESVHYCGECENCKKRRFSICDNFQTTGLHFNGAMTQFFKTNVKFVREIENDIPLNIAALIEPLSVAVHAVKKIKKLGRGNHILVQGPGIIGFLTGLTCIFKKADVTLSGIENDYEFRLSRTKEFGMNSFVEGQQEFNKKADYIIECSGSPAAFKTGLKYLKKGGEIVVIALYEKESSFFLTEFVRNEWSLITSYACDPDDYIEAGKILKAYKDQLQDIITLFPMEQAQKAFDESKGQKVLKAMLYN